MGQVGLVGKIELGILFSFSFLQRTGTGLKALCIPSVKETYEWNGKKVAALCKAGGYIYLLANDDLPGWQIIVRVT